MQTVFNRWLGLLGLVLLVLVACSSPSVTPSIRITPAALTLYAATSSVTFTAEISQSNAAVRWAITPSLGSLDTTSGSKVRYTPPSKVAKNETITLTATLEGTGMQASSRLTIQPATGQSLSLSPSSLSLTAGDPAVDFAVDGAKGVLSCNLQPRLGSCQVNSAAVKYTPPAQLENPITLSLVVGLEGSSTQATAHLTIVPRPIIQPSLRVSPPSTTTSYGAAGTRFSATVANSSGNVTWSLSPEVGTLSATSGNTVIYSPPNFVGSPISVTLTASLDGTTLQSVSQIALQVPSDQALNCTAINPSDNQGIVGYVNRVSFAPGETAEFKLSVPANRSFHMAIYRDGQQSEVIYVQNNLLGRFQPMPESRPYEQDLGWATTTSLIIPTTWKSGLYRAKFTDFANGTCFQIMFAVRGSSSTPRPPIVVLANTFTWQAYNEWGGASFYNCAAGTCGSRPTAPIVNFGRPIRGVLRDNLAAGVQAVVEWFERQGYAYDLITDHDLESDPSALDGYRILVLPRHSEYWSTNMRDRLDGFLARGQYLLSLGGNQMYWKVVVQGTQMEVKKYSDDRQHTIVNEMGGLWRNLGRPEVRVLGNQFTSAGMGSANLAPYHVVDPNHWVLAGTGLQQDQTFGSVCSGWETDKLDSSSPSNVQLIARGTNTDPNRPGQAGADMVYHARPEGGAVFAVGSLAFFSDACRNDPIITQITRNVFERFLGR